MDKIMLFGIALTVSGIYLAGFLRWEPNRARHQFLETIAAMLFIFGGAIVVTHLWLTLVSLVP